jgi:hypothetical protein
LQKCSRRFQPLRVIIHLSSDQYQRLPFHYLIVRELCIVLQARHFDF